MSFSKKFAVLSAAILSLQALPALGASASNALSAEQAALADAYAYLADFGADESVLAAAVNSNGLDVHDYVAVYYSKSNAVNKEIQFVSRTFYSDAIKLYVPSGSTSCINPVNVDNYRPDGITVETNGHTIDSIFDFTPTAANEKLFYITFEQNTSAASVSSIYTHSSSHLWIKNSQGNYDGYNWSSYIDCDVVGLGDVNLDGRIDIQDSVFAAQIANGTYTFTNRRKQLAAADVNRDGSVTREDIDLINQYLAHLINCLY